MVVIGSIKNILQEAIMENITEETVEIKSPLFILKASIMIFIGSYDILQLFLQISIGCGGVLSGLFS